MNKNYKVFVVTPTGIQDMGQMTIQEMIDNNLGYKNDEGKVICNIHLSALGDKDIKAEFKDENDITLETYYLKYVERGKIPLGA